MWVLRDLRGIELPDFAGRISGEIESVPVEDPVPGALVRVDRYPLADHWGFVWAGGVLHACPPSSCFVPMNRFLRMHPKPHYLLVTG